MITDSHCHLGFDALADNVDEILARARAQGVERCLTVACRLEEMPVLLRLLERYPMLCGAFGIHPEYAAQLPDEKELLRLLRSHPKILGVGETGLDYHYSPQTKTQQQEAFLRHIAAAHQLQKPLIVHTREAEEDTWDILSQNREKLRAGGVLHCYTGSPELARRAVEIGFYISASGIITFPRSEELRAVFKEIASERILVETDAPYLAPIPYRGKVNEPAYIVETVKMLAALKGVSFEAMAQQTTHNFKHLFK